MPWNRLGTESSVGRFWILLHGRNCDWAIQSYFDGVARAPEVARCRASAEEMAARVVVILTECSDLEVHRLRIDARQRVIPNWYELDWEHVQATLADWESPEDVDLRLEATDRWEYNLALLRDQFGLAD